MGTGRWSLLVLISGEALWTDQITGTGCAKPRGSLQIPTKRENRSRAPRFQSQLSFCSIYLTVYHIFDRSCSQLRRIILLRDGYLRRSLPCCWRTLFILRYDEERILYIDGVIESNHHRLLPIVN